MHPSSANDYPCTLWNLCESALVKSISLFPPHTLNERNVKVWEMCYREAFVTLYRQRVSGLWKEWEMTFYDYTSMVQWLPREMVEDIAQLEGKKVLPW